MENLAGTQDENQDRASAGREQAEGLTKPRNGPGTGQQPQPSLATSWGPTWTAIPQLAQCKDAETTISPCCMRVATVILHTKHRLREVWDSRRG